jgi:hypothetical protein
MENAAQATANMHSKLPRQAIICGFLKFTTKIKLAVPDRRAVPYAKRSLSAILNLEAFVLKRQVAAASD